MSSRWGWQSNSLFHSPMRVLTRASERRPPVVTLAEIPMWPETFVQMQEAEEESSSEASSMASGSDAQSAAQASASDERPRSRADADESKADASMQDTDRSDRSERSDVDSSSDFGDLSAAPYQPNSALNSKIRLFRGDVTKLAVDAVVNAANSRLAAGGGICGAIFDAADEWKLTKACMKSRQLHGPCPPGQARLTRGYSLPAPFVIHTVGPMDQDEGDLAAAYQSTLDLCVQPQLDDARASESIRIRSVALCCISTGIYGFDNEDACQVALRTTREWLESDAARADQIDAIVFVVFLQKDKSLYEKWMPVFFPVDRKQIEEVKQKRRVEQKEKEERGKQQQQQQQAGKPLKAAVGSRSPEKKKKKSPNPPSSPHSSRSPQPKSSSPAPVRREKQPHRATAAAASGSGSDSSSPNLSAAATGAAPAHAVAPASSASHSTGASASAAAAAAAAAGPLPSPSSLQLKKRKSEEEAAQAATGARTQQAQAQLVSAEQGGSAPPGPEKHPNQPTRSAAADGPEQPAGAVPASPPHEIKRRKGDAQTTSDDVHAHGL